MASNILNVLENIEKGRQNCIKNAKLANLPATDNMDIFNIGNLFLEQNNTEFVNPNNPEVGGGWQRPSDWWDTETILRNAQDIEQDGVTYHPTYIMLLPNTDISTIMSKTTRDNASQGDAYVFSDEPNTLYVGDQTHTWDVSKDKPCSLGYKTRYVIVYMINAELNASINFGSIVKVMEMIVDKLIVPTRSTTQIIISRNNYILNFKCTENTDITTISSSSAFSYCYSLTSINLPKLTTISGSSAFSYCSSLTSINLPTLTTISSSAFSYCSSLTSINLPTLTTISGSAFSYCSSLTSFLFYNTFLSIPETQQFISCVNLKNLQLVTNWRWSLNIIDTDLTHECIIDMFNKLKDLTGADSLTLTIGANNLTKVTDEEKLIATNKNWILA